MRGREPGARGPSQAGARPSRRRSGFRAYQPRWLATTRSRASPSPPTPSRCRSPTPRSPACLRSTASTATCGRPALCALRLVAPARGRPHLGDLDARRRDGRGNGRGRSGAVGRHRRADRARLRRHVPAGLAPATELAGQLHQRDHPARLQGRSGVDDRDDAAAQALRRQGRRGAASSSASGSSPVSSQTRTSPCWRSARRARAPAARREVPPGRPIALLVVALSIVVLSVTSLEDSASRSSARCRRACPASICRRCGSATWMASSRSPSPAFCWPTSRACPRPATLAQKNGYEIDPRQELLGLGAANLAAAFGQGYPVAGGLSQSSVNDKAGRRRRWRSSSRR